MKKINIICIFILIFFTGCNDLEISDVKNHGINESTLERLKHLKETGNYKISVADMEQSILHFFCNTKTSAMRNIVNNAGVKISRIDEDVIAISEKSISNKAISEMVDTFDLFLYEFKIDNHDSAGFVVSSTDNRIGNVLAVVEKSDFYEDSEFADMYFALLINYINAVSACWSSLMLDNTDSRNTYSSIVTSDDYSYRYWTYNDGNLDNIINLVWDQDYPYNSVIQSEKNYPYYAGCGPVALGMILANIEYPKQCSLPKYSDISYDWEKMKEYSNAYMLTSDARHMVALLLYELGMQLNCKYKTSGTSCLNYSIQQYVTANLCDSTWYDYNTKIIKDSINKGYPVLCQGSSKKTVKKYKLFGKTIWTTTTYGEGHYWIVDGFADLSCTAYNKKTNETLDIRDTFLHCNVGWGGWCNGYYLAGVFDFNHLLTNQSFDRSTSSTSYYTENYNKYDVEIFPYIHKDYDRVLVEDDE